MTLFVLLDYLVYTVSILGMLIIVWGVLLGRFVFARKAKS